MCLELLLEVVDVAPRPIGQVDVGGGGRDDEGRLLDALEAPGLDDRHLGQVDGLAPRAAEPCRGRSCGGTVFHRVVPPLAARGRPEPDVGVRGDACEQLLEPARHSGDRRRFVEIRFVQPRAGQAVLARFEEEAQVELRDLSLDLDGRHLETGKPERLGGKVLEDEEHLEERRPPRAPLRAHLFHDARERHVAVRVRLECDVAHAAEELPERCVAGDVGAQDEVVDEEADQRLGLHAVAIGDVGSDDDLRVAGEA